MEQSKTKPKPRLKPKPNQTKPTITETIQAKPNQTKPNQTNSHMPAAGLPFQPDPPWPATLAGQRRAREEHAAALAEAEGLAGRARTEAEEAKAALAEAERGVGCLADLKVCADQIAKESRSLEEAAAAAGSLLSLLLFLVAGMMILLLPLPVAFPAPRSPAPPFARPRAPRSPSNRVS